MKKKTIKKQDSQEKQIEFLKQFAEKQRENIKNQKKNKN